MAVRLTLPNATRNQVERFGRVAVFATVQLGSADPVRGADLVLTSDPRTARLSDAGRDVTVKGGAATLRVSCPAGHLGPCRGTVKR